MSMFWGLCMKPNRKYTQTIVKSFHISGVALDDGASAKLYITADKNKFIVASLSKAMPQVPLDLNFCKGDKIMFQTTGDATVSLIGYLHDSDLSDDEEYDDDEYAALAEKLQKKGAAKGDENDSESEEESDEEEEDDDKLAAEYSSFLEGDESGEDEEDDSEDDDDEDGEGEEEEEESDEEDTPKAKKAKIAESAKKPAKEQNGVSKGEQKQQQQQKSKKDKKAAAAPEAKKEQPKGKESKQQPAGERTIAGGVKVQDMSAGNGPEAKQGKRVSVYYIGRLKSNNKTFDSMQKGNGFKFALGAGEVIKGWDVGVAGMKVGGKRRITCPAHMAYGARGHPPTIPPNSTLVFDVELKAVH
ncbi:39 kDa FK506-binding nuclear protein [Drosophila innubila]|uniref:39 kDa FK506-binding nuclear protein n=1 Tax=Drosophila innubila TaxID=198719 RepID=UPI00148E1CD3|nr:39 kDa FK506-binding nuclear protein [Drosophila innubila]